MGLASASRKQLPLRMMLRHAGAALARFEAAALALSLKSINYAIHYAYFYQQAHDARRVGYKYFGRISRDD